MDITSGNMVRADASAGDITLTIVTPVQGATITIKKNATDNSENSVIVYSPDLIDGAETAELSTPGESITLFYNGLTHDII